MTPVVHARLDPETRRILQRLKRRHGWSDSEAIRRGIRALAEATEMPRKPRQIIGLGAFASDVDDLGSNRAYLDDFGK